ncbi:MAG: hypothetical protein B6D35_08145 [Candidatus Brocadia sp. UTAMX2]|nr:MAG: hypothetical protein B6D35_08145 [Candidatus Brocadia sp. UTAMX2]
MIHFPILSVFVNTFSDKMHALRRMLYPLFFRLVVFSCILIFIIWGMQRVWYSLTELNVFKVSPAAFSFQTPSWMNDHFTDSIKRVAALNDYYGMYENNLTQKIADIYGGVVLVKDVDSVKRVFPNKLAIKLLLRKPFACIKSRSNSYLVDEDGVLLPKEYYTLKDTAYDSLYIQSNKLTRLPLYGSEWDDKGIKAGIALVKFLRANNIHNLFKIVSVDVSNVCKRRSTSKSDIVLWTENNTQIRWGCSSLCNEQNELSDEEKLQNLLSIAKAEGTNLRLMEYVDVRWKKPSGKRWTKVNDMAEVP